MRGCPGLEVARVERGHPRDSFQSRPSAYSVDQTLPDPGVGVGPRGDKAPELREWEHVTVSAIKEWANGEGGGNNRGQRSEESWRRYFSGGLKAE